MNTSEAKHHRQACCFRVHSESQGPLLHSRVHGSSCSADQQILGICFVLPVIHDGALIAERYGQFVMARP